MKFTELNLNSKIIKGLELSGYKNATEVQEKSIPVVLEGKDVVVRSQTGSGKTMAFVLPIVQNIDYSLNTVQALIVCPTRELALQVAAETTKITTTVGDVRVVTVYGGSDINRQIKALKRKPQIVIGTPGRIMDHMDRKTLKLHELKAIVLDEADEMLNMGFKEDIEKILKATPKQRQTLLFSATFPESIRRITKNYQNEPVSIEVGSENRSLENIKQFFVMADRRAKKQAFVNLLKMVKPKNAIIFSNTKKMVDELDAVLKSEGYFSGALHGDMRQSQRRKVMTDMKSGKINILIASDVAARGIDIDNIDYVINYDLPNNVEYFLHRIGRTARAGKKGSAITILNTRQQLALLRDFEKQTASNITEIEVKVHLGETRLREKPRSESTDRGGKQQSRSGRSGGGSDGPRRENDRNDRSNRGRTRKDGERNERNDRNDRARRDSERSDRPRRDGERSDRPRRDGERTGGRDFAKKGRGKTAGRETEQRFSKPNKGAKGKTESYGKDYKGRNSNYEKGFKGEKEERFGKDVEKSKPRKGKNQNEFKVSARKTRSSRSGSKFIPTGKNNKPGAKRR